MRLVIWLLSLSCVLNASLASKLPFPLQFAVEHVLQHSPSSQTHAKAIYYAFSHCFLVPKELRTTSPAQLEAAVDKFLDSADDYLYPDAVKQLFQLFSEVESFVQKNAKKQLCCPIGALYRSFMDHYTELLLDYSCREMFPRATTEDLVDVAVLTGRLLKESLSFLTCFDERMRGESNKVIELCAKVAEAISTSLTAIHQNNHKPNLKERKPITIGDALKETPKALTSDRFTLNHLDELSKAGFPEQSAYTIVKYRHQTDMFATLKLFCGIHAEKCPNIGSALQALGTTEHNIVPQVLIDSFAMLLERKWVSKSELAGLCIDVLEDYLVFGVAITETLLGSLIYINQVNKLL